MLDIWISEFRKRYCDFVVLPNTQNQNVEFVFSQIWNTACSKHWLQKSLESWICKFTDPGIKRNWMLISKPPKSVKLNVESLFLKSKRQIFKTPIKQTPSSHTSTHTHTHTHTYLRKNKMLETSNCQNPKIEWVSVRFMVTPEWVRAASNEHKRLYRSIGGKSMTDITKERLVKNNNYWHLFPPGSMWGGAVISTSSIPTCINSVCNTCWRFRHVLIMTCPPGGRLGSVNIDSGTTNIYWHLFPRSVSFL